MRRQKRSKTIKPGDLARVKITGETVQVIEVENSLIKASRARVGRDGIEYELQTFFPFALETVEANIDREFAEVIYRQQLMKQKLHEDADVEVAFDSDEPVQ